MDPKKLWQDQPTEPTIVTLKYLRRRARDLHEKTRSELFGSAAVHVVCVVLSVIGLARGHNVTQRAAFAIALAWALAGAYVTNRGMWSAPLPGDAALATGIEFCRREIQRRRSLFGRAWLWLIGPLLFSGLAFASLFPGKAGQTVVGAKLLLNALPFITLMIIWFVALGFLRRRQRSGLQREIDELDEIEKESRS